MVLLDSIMAKYLERYEGSYLRYKYKETSGIISFIFIYIINEFIYYDIKAVKEQPRS